MNPQINTIDLNERPFTAPWKVSQARDFASVHCRDSVQPDRNPMELRTSGFDIKTTEAQHHRRLLLQQKIVEREAGTAIFAVQQKIADDVGRAPRGLNDGKEVVFISHTGEISPSGFLPMSAGYVRQQKLSDIDRESPRFQRHRDTSKLEGKWGYHEFKVICDGSRARAYALTGIPNAKEPCCLYIPKGIVQPPPSLKQATGLHILHGA
jgi:hypothetical protein